MLIAVVYAIAILVLATLGAHLLVLTVLAGRGERLAEGSVPEPAIRRIPQGKLPNVTVQVPVYNEKFVIRDIIDACTALSYPRSQLEIQILDDSTDETAFIAGERVAYWRKRGVDIHHVRRPYREGFKAGALQNGLNIARGDFLAVFDADFLPPADFLLHVMDAFADPNVGFVQGRWTHLNEGDSLLTRVQAANLDVHFMIEQRARALAGCFISFNGTCGVWRRETIIDAGGWSGDTITEDLDLSYRAQTKGWNAVYLPGVEVPGQLPDDINGLRSQQFRWTKGSIETARKCFLPLWRSNASGRQKVEGSFHLTANLAFPFILVAAFLHAPVLLSVSAGTGPGPAYLALLGVGLAGFCGILASQIAASRWLYPQWTRILKMIPWFLAGTIGLSVHNSIAVVEALLRRRTPFIRTPKRAAQPDGCLEGFFYREYNNRRGGIVPYIEVSVGLYCAGGAALLAGAGMAGALPFQLIFAAGFLLNGVTSIVHSRGSRGLSRRVEYPLMHAGNPLP